MDDTPIFGVRDHMTTSAAKANRNAEIVDRLEAEIARLRAALYKIAHDSYGPEDDKLTSDQPMMIWNLVALAALGDEQRPEEPNG